MASSMMLLGVTIKLFDQLSGPLGNVSKNLDGVRQSAEKLGRAGLADGLILGAGLKTSISAFADLEDAATRLKVTMMDKNGMTGAFTQVNDLAIKLGNKLPGTTADFENMMAALKAQGISDESILGGVGEAAANLGVLLKLPSEEAAVFAAKMKVATGTADKDMLGLMDTIQRLYFTGVNSTEMMYSFARSAGALKVFKIQGLEASKALAPIFGMLIKGGLSGETVGTGFASLLNNFADAKKLGKANQLLAGDGLKLNLFDKTGNIKPIRELVSEFDKLKNLDPLKLNAVLKALTGGGQDQQMLAQIINNGLTGYDKVVADMEKQANLQKRVNSQLGTLANLWEAATGTFTNALAAFAETFSPEIKALTNWFGKLSEGVFNFTKSHPLLAKWIGIAALGFVLVATGLGGLALAFAFVLRYIALVVSIGPALFKMWGLLASLAGAAGSVLMWLGRVLLIVGRAFLLNPIGLAITAIALGAYLIYRNWDTLKTWFKSFFQWIGEKAKVLHDMMPEWMRKYTLPGLVTGFASNLAQAQPTMAPNLQSPGKSGIDAGGTFKISVEDNRTVVKETRTNDPRFRFNVANGPYMATVD